MKTEVYSWRVAPEVRQALEEAARRRRESMAQILDRIAREWIERERRELADDAAEQARLHAKLDEIIGSISGGNPARSTSVREVVRERVRQKIERQRRSR